MNERLRDCVRALRHAIALALLPAGIVHAAPGAFTDRAAFEANVAGAVAELDFESLAAGAVLSGTTQTPTGATTSITFPPAVPDVLAPTGPALDLQVVEDAGNNPTVSGQRSLGVVDPGNFDAITAGTALSFAFTQPVDAFGLTLVTPEEPTAALFDDDARLTVAGEPAAALSLAGGQVVATSGGREYRAYFLGIVGNAPFSSANLEYGGGAPDSAFFFNVDDLLIPVPEPDRALLLTSGALLLGVLSRNRTRNAAHVRSEGGNDMRRTTTRSFIWGAIMALCLAQTGHAQGRPSLIDLDARLTQVIDGLCGGDAANCGLIPATPVAGQIDIDGGTVVADFASARFAFTKPSGAGPIFDQVTVVLEASNATTQLLTWVDTFVTLSDLTLTLPDPQSAGTADVLTFTAPLLQRFEATGDGGRATLGFTFESVTFTWLGSASSWNQMLNTGSGCTASGPKYVALAGNDASLLAPSEDEISTYSYFVATPPFGAPPSSFEFAGDANAISACLLRTGGSGNNFDSSYDRLSPLSDTFSLALREQTVAVTTAVIDSYELSIVGASLTERVTLDLGGGKITTRVFDPANGNELTSTDWSF